MRIHNCLTKAYSILCNYRMPTEHTGSFIVTQRTNIVKGSPSPTFMLAYSPNESLRHVDKLN